MLVSHREGVGTFDPRLWLNAFTRIGGGYALISDRRLTFVVEGCEAGAAAQFMTQIAGQSERQDALKAAIERRQAGEA